MNSKTKQWKQKAEAFDKLAEKESISSKAHRLSQTFKVNAFDEIYAASLQLGLIPDDVKAIEDVADLTVSLLTELSTYRETRKDEFDAQKLGEFLWDNFQMTFAGQAHKDLLEPTLELLAELQELRGSHKEQFNFHYPHRKSKPCQKESIQAPETPEEVKQILRSAMREKVDTLKSWGGNPLETDTVGCTTRAARDEADYQWEIPKDGHLPHVPVVFNGADFTADEDGTNAEFICKAVNAHDELVEALSLLIDAVGANSTIDWCPADMQIYGEAREVLAKCK